MLITQPDIIFEYRYVKGRDLFYPVNENAKEFLNIFPSSSPSGRISLTFKQIKRLRSIGITFKLIGIPITWYFTNKEQKEKHEK